jgi:hypothetical protein
MSEDKSWATVWQKAIVLVVRAYRMNNPLDERTDEELVVSLLDHLAKSEVIEKGGNGKYLLPGIKDPEVFLDLLADLTSLFMVVEIVMKCVDEGSELPSIEELEAARIRIRETL